MSTPKDPIGEQVHILGAINPRLSEAIDQVSRTGVSAGSNIGPREWALYSMATLVALGDMPDQMNVYANAATQAGATDEEILDVINLASVYVGFPRAVNATRAIQKYLVQAREARLPNVKESIVSLGDHDTTVWDNGGEGVPILLVHALSMDHNYWREIYPKLASGRRVVAYDLRGHGRARGAPLTRDLEHLASDAKKLLDALNIERTDVYGASYGGAVAQYLAVAHPQSVRSMALLATSALGSVPLLGQRADDAEENGMEAQVAKSIIRWFLPETIAANTWAVRYARDRVRRTRVADWAAAWRAMARLDVVEAAKQMTVPTLILSGVQDLSSTPEVMKWTADLYPNGEFVSLDPGTHFMPLEQPELVSDALLAFRRRVDAAA
jgi:3-oxoadipate enol-lactonase